MTQFLESDEVARRLGIKRNTLYAYVSRGLLPSYPAPGGRQSLFDVADVERLARRSRTERRHDGRSVAVTTSVTQLRQDGPTYRGRPLATLLDTPFEAVAELLWQVDPARHASWAPAETGAVPDLQALDLLRWVTVMCGARDPTRGDLQSDAVCAAARRLIATLVDVVPSGTVADPLSGSISARLARRLSGAPVPSEVARGVNTALVVLADHELATSTMAVRLASSTRASLYDAVLSGLGAMAGPLHGGAAPLAAAVLRDANQRGPAGAIDRALRWQGLVPGFGHSLDVYGSGDPRFAMLWSVARELATDEERSTMDGVVRIAGEHDLPPPNVDLALAGLVHVTGMDADAGPLIFTIARVAGWTAHFLEELLERPLRFRFRAVYAARPGQIT